jgi:putative transposase
MCDFGEERSSARAAAYPPMNLPSYPERETGRLYLGRTSAPGARYFVTFVSAHRQPWLAQPTGARAVLAALQSWHAAGDGRIFTATVMPDHVHVLFELGRTLPLGRCVARWKAEVRRRIAYAGAWQRDFWEHLVRADESWEDYGLYLFLNPCCAGLARAGDAWPWWWAPEPGLFRFAGALDANEAPPSAWLDGFEARLAELATGE